MFFWVLSRQKGLLFKIIKRFLEGCKEILISFRQNSKNLVNCPFICSGRMFLTQKST
jgi:hypothetical protein